MGLQLHEFTERTNLVTPAKMLPHQVGIIRKWPSGYVGITVIKTDDGQMIGLMGNRWSSDNVRRYDSIADYAVEIFEPGTELSFVVT